MGNAEVQTQASNEVGPVMAAVKMWLSAYRVELLLFVGCFAVLSGFSSQRFLRQSAAPHFIYQAQAWLEGRVDVDAQVLPNLEDWACVREVSGAKVRCEGALMPIWFIPLASRSMLTSLAATLNHILSPLLPSAPIISGLS